MAEGCSSIRARVILVGSRLEVCVRACTNRIREGMLDACTTTDLTTRCKFWRKENLHDEGKEGWMMTMIGNYWDWGRWLLKFRGFGGDWHFHVVDSGQIRWRYGWWFCNWLNIDWIVYRSEVFLCGGERLVSRWSRVTPLILLPCSGHNYYMFREVACAAGNRD